MIDKELKNLELVPEEFIAAVEASNKKIFQEIFKILTQLDLVDGNIAPTVANLERIELIKKAIADALFEGEYIDGLKTYAKSFNEQGQAVLGTFDTSAKLADNEMWKATIKQAQTNVVSLFDEAAVENVISKPIADILTQSISSSVKFSDAVQQIKDFIEGNNEIDGRLVKYAKTYARDAFANFDRSFTQLVNQEYDIQYWEYAGGTVKDTRDFCKERVGRVFTTEEVKEWASLDWQGKNPATNASNIFTLLGGYNCMHTLLPVSKERAKKLSI